MFGGLRLVRRSVGIIHVTDVYVVFGGSPPQILVEPRPRYLGTHAMRNPGYLPQTLQTAGIYHTAVAFRISTSKLLIPMPLISNLYIESWIISTSGPVVETHTPLPA